MSNGVDSLANGNNKDLNDLVSQKPESTYSGQAFAGSLNSVSVNDMKGSENYSVPSSIGNNPDSVNTLGASTAPMNIQSSQRK
jgi:hypothetical protein